MQNNSESIQRLIKLSDLIELYSDDPENPILDDLLNEYNSILKTI